MKRVFFIVLCMHVVRVHAYVPLQFRVTPSPTVSPVHGPIRPRTLIRSIPTASVAPLVSENWRTAQNEAAGWGPTTAIFWGKEWTDRRFASDKVVGIDRWYEGYPDSNYAHLTDEYTKAHGIANSRDIGYQGHIIDARSELHPVSENIDAAETEIEICKEIAERRVTATPRSYYVVYSSKKPPAGGACSLHGVSYCGTYMNSGFAYALIYNLDGVDPCDPRDHFTGHSQGLAAIANASARSLSDQITNWGFRGFFDQYGNEIDDKCAWTFHVPFVTLSNGTIWKLQGLWSEAAYAQGAGYSNWLGEKGCLDGR